VRILALQWTQPPTTYVAQRKTSQCHIEETLCQQWVKRKCMSTYVLNSEFLWKDFEMHSRTEMDRRKRKSGAYTSISSYCEVLISIQLQCEIPWFSSTSSWLKTSARSNSQVAHVALQIWMAEEEHFRFPGLKSCWKHNHNRMKKEKKENKNNIAVRNRNAIRKNRRWRKRWRGNFFSTNPLTWKQQVVTSHNLRERNAETKSKHKE
jgi:hypothetical protein